LALRRKGSNWRTRKVAGMANRLPEIGPRVFVRYSPMPIRAVAGMRVASIIAS